LAEIDRVVETFLQDRRQLQCIDADEVLSRLRHDQIILLDVRPVEEYATAHLPHARSMPVAELEAHLSEFPREKEIVAYCRGPYCVFADEAVALLGAHGYLARRLEHGVAEWHALGLPLDGEREQLI
jgi:rhodanese-related sulfurtransferase